MYIYIAPKSRVADLTKAQYVPGIKREHDGMQSPEEVLQEKANTTFDGKAS